MLKLLRAIPGYIPQVLTRKRIVSCLVFASIPALIWFAAALYIFTEQGFLVVEVLRDPAQQSEESSFLGFLSSNGIWLWVSAAAISYFSALTFEPTSLYRHRELLILLGLFSSVLAIDDFFLLHDRHFNQWLLYAMYMVIAGLLFLRHHEIIVAIDGFAFLLALFFLGMSISSDSLQGFFEYTRVQIFEESFKFMGAATWLYFAGVAAAYKDSKASPTAEPQSVSVSAE